MKKKFFVVALVLILILTAVGCSTEKPDAEGEPDGAVVSEQDTEIDSSLEGAALLNSLSGERPKTMSMKMTMTSFNMTTVSTIYYDGDNTRTETVIPEYGTSVLAYNADEKMMYSYVEGSGQGIRIIGADIASAEEAGLMMDLNTKFSEMTVGASDDMIARVEEVDGDKVVYIETTEFVEEMGEITVKMWYSPKYKLPLKYEIFTGQSPLMTMIVSDMKSGIKIDKNMFAAPSGMNFEDVNMDALMEE